MKLPREFYLRSALEIAPELIGKVLVHRTPEGITRGIIVETEAYMGEADAAAHSYRSRRTGRTNIQFGPGGYAYVYTLYGIHSCMNVVVNRENLPEVVLLRALEPVEGLELMAQRRKRDRDLCNGPGKLCQAMGIDKGHYGMDLCGDELYIESVSDVLPPIRTGKRINIDYAGEAVDYPWRFCLAGSKFLSVPL